MPEKNNKQSLSNPVIKIFINVLISATIGFGVFIFLVCVFSFITVKMKSPGDCSVIFAIISTVISNFAAGFIASRKIRKNGLAIGLLTGFNLLIFIIFTFVIFADFKMSQNTLLLIPSALIPSALFGVFAVNVKKRNRR